MEHGARSVVGVEITREMVDQAEAFSRARRATGLRFLVGSGEDLPLSADAVDLITMNDVMEHVVSPRMVLSECWRVLRPGGLLVIVFPPYYDLTAGSHLDGYATSLPGLHVLFPTGTLRAAAREVLDERMGEQWHEVLRDEPTDKLWNLNGLTVRGFKRLVRESRFTPQSMRYLGHLDHRLSDHRGSRRRTRMPFFIAAELPAQIPWLQELCCLRVCAVLRK
jgi:SAM-dependent methyltransferase